jgi:hypothetical protein
MSPAQTAKEWLATPRHRLVAVGCVLAAVLLLAGLIYAALPDRKPDMVSSLPGHSNSSAPSAQSQALTSGFIVESIEEPHSVVIGFIDPTSGAYSRYSAFDVGSASSLPSNTLEMGDMQGSDRHLAPDLDRYAATMQVNGTEHAGWIDKNGTFTDVNAGSGTPGPFGGSPAPYVADVFDGAGNFFYGEVGEDNNQQVYKVANGQTSGGTLFGQTISYSTTGLTRTGTGEIVIAPRGCNTENYLNPSQYLIVAKTKHQIYKSNVADDPGLGSCGDGGDGGTPLLPTNNTSYVDDPIANSDGSKIAFKRGSKELWVVDTTGTGTPEKIGSSGLDLTFYRLIGWK